MNFVSFNIALAALILTVAQSVMAYAPPADLVNRYGILTPVAPARDHLKFREDIGRELDEARRAIDAMNWVRDSGWTERVSDLCFETGQTTFDYNVCASNQLAWVVGTVTRVYQDIKRVVRSSDYFARQGDPILLTRFLQNAVIARVKIAEDLCTAETAAWSGGSGRAAAYLGCHSRVMRDVSEMELLAAFARYEVSPGNGPERNDISVSDLVERVRLEITEGVSNRETDVTEAGMREADVQLNAQYRQTLQTFRAWYESEPENLNRAMTALVSQQRAWIDYRDAYCQAYSVFLFPGAQDHLRYGSYARLRCLRTMTQNQRELLNNLAKQDSL